MERKGWFSFFFQLFNSSDITAHQISTQRPLKKGKTENWQKLFSSLSTAKYITKSREISHGIFFLVCKLCMYVEAFASRPHFYWHFGRSVFFFALMAFKLIS